MLERQLIYIVKYIIESLIYIEMKPAYREWKSIVAFISSSGQNIKSETP